MENIRPYVQEINVDPSNYPLMNNVVLPSVNDVVALVKTKHISATLANTIVTKVTRKEIWPLELYLKFGITLI
jgi:hypothetical protein